MKEHKIQKASKTDDTDVHKSNDKVAGKEKVHRVDSIVKHYSTYSQWHPSTHY